MWRPAVGAGDRAAQALRARATKKTPSHRSAYGRVLQLGRCRQRAKDRGLVMATRAAVVRPAASAPIPARDGVAALAVSPAKGSKQGKPALGVDAAALRARNGLVGPAHRAHLFKGPLAIRTAIFVDRHRTFPPLFDSRPPVRAMARLISIQDDVIVHLLHVRVKANGTSCRKSGI